MEQPRVSVIIPVKNGEATLGDCIACLLESDYKNIEIIVVDDHSTDGGAEVAEHSGARVMKLADKRGVSAARNVGAEHAAGDIIVFTDADVLFHKNTISELVKKISEPGVDGAVGLFSDNIPYKNYCSRFKNMWMRYTYEQMPERIALFFTSVAAVRVAAFKKAGGFDELYIHPSVEDTEIGRRMADAGLNIQLCRTAEVTHNKFYSFGGLISTDFTRSAALVRLMLREFASNKTIIGRRAKKQFSVPVSYPVTGLLFTVFLILIISAGFYPHLSSLSDKCILFMGGVIFVSIHLLHSNNPFYKNIRETKGKFDNRGIGYLILVDYVVITYGALWGIISFIFGKRY